MTDEVVFQKLKQRAEMKLDRQFMAGLKIDVIDSVFDDILIRFEKEVYAERKQCEVECTYKYYVPDGWFQMFKVEYAPKWFLKYWPIRFKERIVFNTEQVEWVVPRKEFDGYDDRDFKQIILPGTYAKFKP